MKQVLITTALCLSLAGLAFAQPQLSGHQSGNLGPGTYLVVGTIDVPVGQTLTIAPGTTFLHNGYWKWNIYGTLHAVGTQTDSIKWLRQNPVSERRWGGLRFQNGAPSGSIVSYCVVEWGYTPTTSPSTDMGGCIFSDGVSLTISHSRISHGDAWWGGGGICGNNASFLNITDNLICDNKDNAWKGGGIYLFNCTYCSVNYNVICRNQSTGG
jgi:hypothetical protein